MGIVLDITFHLSIWGLRTLKIPPTHSGRILQVQRVSRQPSSAACKVIVSFDHIVTTVSLALRPPSFHGDAAARQRTLRSKFVRDRQWGLQIEAHAQWAVWIVLRCVGMCADPGPKYT